MKKIYMHIGTPKTGTSSIQYFLWHCDELATRKIIYPKTRIVGIKGICDERISQYYNCEWEKWRTLSEQDLSEMFKRYLNEYDTVVFSGESFWGEVTDKKKTLSIIQRAALDAGAELKIIVYLRPQEEYFESLYKEIIATFVVKETISEALDFSHASNFSLVHSSMDYYENLIAIREAIGNENLIVGIYEKQQWKNGNLIEDFMNIVDAKMDISDEHKMVFRNERMNTAAIEIKRLINCSVAADNEMAQMLFYEIVKLGNRKEGEENKKSLLTNEQRVLIHNKYSEGNAKIAREFLGREDGKLFMHSPAIAVKCELEYIDLLENAVEILASGEFRLESGIAFLSSQICELQNEVSNLQKELSFLKNTSLIKFVKMKLRYWLRQ